MTGPRLLRRELPTGNMGYDVEVDGEVIGHVERLPSVEYREQRRSWVSRPGTGPEPSLPRTVFLWLARWPDGTLVVTGGGAEETLRRDAVDTLCHHHARRTRTATT